MLPFDGSDSSLLPLVSLDKCNLMKHTVCESYLWNNSKCFLSKFITLWSSSSHITTRLLAQLCPETGATMQEKRYCINILCSRSNHDDGTTYQWQLYILANNIEWNLLSIKWILTHSRQSWSWLWRMRKYVRNTINVAVVRIKLN